MAGVVNLSDLITKKTITYPRMCESCNIMLKKNSYSKHIKKCFAASAPENYPKFCIKCDEVFFCHKTFIHHKEYCTPTGNSNSGESPKRKRPKKDYGTIEIIDYVATEGTNYVDTEEADNNAGAVGVSSNLVPVQYSVDLGKCETCCSMERDKATYNFHKRNCLASKSLENNLKRSTRLDNETVKITDSTTEIMDYDAIEIWKEQKEVSEELKKISAHCQNIYEECKISRENSASMIALLKENNALLKKIASSLNLIVQIKAAKNNIKIVNKNY